MMQIEGTITTRHEGRAGQIAASLAPDNLRSMTTIAEGDRVVTTFTGTQIRSVIASVDDYLLNLTTAQDATGALLQQKKP
jgi:hypothetical protein